MRAWDYDADEYIPVVIALYEDGSSSVDLLTSNDVDVVDAEPSDV